MERSKKLILLFCVFVVICGVTFGVTRYEEHKENIKNSDEIIVRIDKDFVTALSWKTETGSLSFTKKEEWTYDDDEAFPVDEEKINSLLDLFSEFGTSFCIEDVENYSQYGLSNPICSIEITTSQEPDGIKTSEEPADESTAESSQEDGLAESDSDSSNQERVYTYKILLGDYSKMDSQRYVSVGDGKVYLVSTDPYERFNVGLEDMIKNDEIPSFAKINGIQFEGNSEYGIIREEESNKSYNTEDVYFTEIQNTSQPLDNSLVENYAAGISSLYLNTYVTYNATEDELASYGLDEPDLTVKVNYTDEDGEEKEENTFVLHISRDPKEKEESGKQESEESEGDSVTAFARIGDSQIVYELSGSDYEELMKASYNDLRHQNIFYGNFDDVYKFDFTLEGKVYTMTAKEKDGGMTYYYGNEELDFSNIKSKIQALAATEFTDEPAEGKEEIRMKLYLDSEDYPEIEIALYRYDGDNCLATVNGKAVAMVSRAAAVDVIESVNTVIF